MKANTKYFLKRNIGGCAFVFAFLTTVASAQSALSWEQVKAKFEAVNPVLKADAANVEEMKAEEITAFLRPNPQFTVARDAAMHDGVLDERLQQHAGYECVLETGLTRNRKLKLPLEARAHHIGV